MATRRRSTIFRRQQIINAARRLIIRYGSEHITVRRIAQQVGISEAAIYRHFTSKRDILSLLADDIRENLIGDIDEANQKNHSSLDTIDAVLRNHISAIEQRRGISFQVIAEIVSLGDRVLNKKIAGVVNDYIDRLAQLLAQAKKSGEVREDVDPKAAATLLFGMIQGIVTIWALNGYRENLTNKYTPLWNIFQQTVTKKPQAAIPAV